jgi:hypothetical protein
MTKLTDKYLLEASYTGDYAGKPDKKDGEKNLQNAQKAISRVLGLNTKHPITTNAHGEMAQAYEIPNRGNKGLFRIVWAPWKATDWSKDGMKKTWAIAIQNQVNDLIFVRSEKQMITRLKKIYLL